MLELVKELMEREWSFKLVNDDGYSYRLEMVYRNGYIMIYNDKEAEEFLEEIKSFD